MCWIRRTPSAMRRLRARSTCLNVWGTWCAACREEHEALLAIAQQHVVPIIGLDYMDQRDKAKQWLAQLGNPYQAVAFDTDGRTAIDWGVYGAPETFLVDAAGPGDLQIHLAHDPGGLGTRIPAAHRRRAPGRRMTAARRGCPRCIGALALCSLARCASRRIAARRRRRRRRWMPTASSRIRRLQARFERITKELRCLVCQNESIADSNVELASDLRRQVREMLVAGKSDDAIFDFMTDRYGEFVRFSPPLEPKTLLIWGAPFIMLLLGGVIIYRVVRQRSRMPLDDEPATGP